MGCHSFSLNSEGVKFSFSATESPESRVGGFKNGAGTVPRRSALSQSRNFTGTCRPRPVPLTFWNRPSRVQRWYGGKEIAIHRNFFVTVLGLEASLTRFQWQKSAQQSVNQNDLPGAQGRQGKPSEKFARSKAALAGFTE